MRLTQVLITLTMLSVCHTGHLHAQSTFSATVPQTVRTGLPGSEIVFDVSIRNISGSEITLSFVRHGSILPAGWESALCVGAACFPSSIDSIALSPAFGLNPLAPGDSCAFSLHFYTTSSAGSGTVRVLIRSGRGDADTLGLLFTGSTVGSAVREPEVQVASEIILSSYPNPFNPSTTLTWTMDHEAYVTLSVFDLLGHELATPVHDVLRAGTHRVVFDASEHASGVYIAQVRTGAMAVSRLIVRTK